MSLEALQEGRMRGQAFVTFPTTDLAADALVSLVWSEAASVSDMLFRRCA